MSFARRVHQHHTEVTSALAPAVRGFELVTTDELDQELRDHLAKPMTPLAAADRMHKPVGWVFWRLRAGWAQAE